ncbi:MAG: hypothetical protein ACE366_12505 [Bradymonadia bacterium]
MHIAALSLALCGCSDDLGAEAEPGGNDGAVAADVSVPRLPDAGTDANTAERDAFTQPDMTDADVTGRDGSLSDGAFGDAQFEDGAVGEDGAVIEDASVGEDGAIEPPEDMGASDANVGQGPVMILAGDSWSTGLVQPTEEALAARGLGDVTVRWNLTANAGSQARGWVDNEHPPAFGGGRDMTRPRMIDGLLIALDTAPRADVLVLSLSGNDFNRLCSDGWGEWPGQLQDRALDEVEDDLAEVVRFAIQGRPHLRVVLFGYDYFHFEGLVALGMSLDGLNTRTYNEALVELGRRQRAVADALGPQVVYAHNYGWLQHVFGDTIHPPFSIPNPLTGYPEYGPGAAPAPGQWPAYTPYPGGLLSYPAPLERMPDGIHPDALGFRSLMDHVLDQVLENWLLEAR